MSGSAFRLPILTLIHWLVFLPGPHSVGYHRSKINLKNEQCKFSHFFILFKIVLALQYPVNFEGLNILIILILPIHCHVIFLHVFKSLTFLKQCFIFMYRSCTSLVIFLPNCFMFHSVTVGSSAFYISVSDRKIPLIF